MGLISFAIKKDKLFHNGHLMRKLCPDKGVIKEAISYMKEL